MHNKVKEVLISERINNSDIKYYPNQGNAGDSLINVGFYQLAKEVGIKYKKIGFSDLPTIKNNDVVLIGGGGALVPEWGSTTEFVAGLIGKCKKIIILPQSIRGVDDLLTRLSEEDIVFCREKYSYKQCKDLNLRSQVYISDDLAMNVDLNTLSNSKRKLPKLNFKNIMRLTIYCYHMLIRSKFNKHIHAFRCDKEANSAINVKRSRLNDFSAIARFGNETEEQSNLSAYMFIKLINMYDEISTDRLHVIVASFLLNKKINAYPNSYYKVQGVIEQSLKEYPALTLISTQKND